MKIPDVAYEPMWIGNDEISVFPRKYSSEKNISHIKLPKWLVLAIEDRVIRAREEGRAEVREGLNKLLGR